MLEELFTFIQTHQEPISESLGRCNIDVAVHRDDSLDELLEFAKKNINVFPFSNVKPCWFQLHANVSIGKAVQSLRDLDLSTRIEGKGNDEILSRSVESLDNALIIAGGGDEDTRNLIHEILRRLDHLLYPYASGSDEDDNTDDLDNDDTQGPPSKKRRLNINSNSSPSSRPLPSNLAFVPKISHPIPHLNNPSLTGFESRIHDSNTPLILQNILFHWPALTKWRDPDYWLRRTLNGHRLVPIELGQSYTDEDWRQEIMKFRRFLNEYILKGDNADEIGYLAQHDLFSQIPELRADVAVPDYCFADMPMETNGDDGLHANEDGINNTELMKNVDTRINEKASGTTTTNQATKEITPTTKCDITSDGMTHPEHPPTHRHQITDDHNQPRSDPSNHINANPDADADADSSPASSQSFSSPPPQIHQNIWFGTRTVTPLHHDPYSNILTQIHGTKYIRLYSPEYTARLYPRSAQEVAPHVVEDIPDTRSKDNRNGDVNQSPNRDGNRNDNNNDDDNDNDNDDRDGLPHQSPPQATTTATIDMSNTSTVPLWSIEQSPYEDWDEQYPGFSNVPYVEALLGEGDAIYIPKGWWHYVRGVSAVGIGVSFWW